MNMRLSVVGGAFLVLSASALPVSNLLIKADRQLDANAVAGKTPEFQTVARILGVKCLDCHSTRTGRPFYMSLPVARDIIAQDIANASAALDMRETLFQPGLPPPEHVLTQIEFVLAERRMPPRRYLALHWDAFVTRDDIAAIRKWIAAERRSVAALNARRLPPGSSAEPRIEMRGVSYVPAKASLRAGTPITWTNLDVVPHTVTAADGSWDSGEVRPGGTFIWIAEGAGQVHYLCRYHGGMTGTLEVR